MDPMALDKQALREELERIMASRHPHLLPIEANEIALSGEASEEPIPLQSADRSTVQHLWESGCRLLLLFDPEHALIEWIGNELPDHPERIIVFIVRDRTCLLESMAAAHTSGWLDRPGSHWVDMESLRNQIQGIFLKNSLVLFRPERIATHVCAQADQETRQFLEEESVVFSQWFTDEREAHNSRFARLQAGQCEQLRIWGYALSGPAFYVHGPMLDALGRGFAEAGIETEICSVDPGDPAFSCRLLDSLTRFEPSVCLCLNTPPEDSYSQFLDAQAAQSLPQTRLVWAVDHPRFTALYPFSERDVVWASDDSYAEAARSLGAQRVAIAPPAADLDRDGVVREELRCPIAFVGIYHDTSSFLDAFSPWARNTVEELVRRMLSGEDVIGERGFLDIAPYGDLEESRPVFEEFCKRLGRAFRDDETKLLFVASVTAGSRRRAEVVKALLPMGICVYGNAAWRAVLDDAADERFRGQAHRCDLPDIYASAEINLNCHSPQLPRGFNPRDFNVLRTGGCLLSDYVADMDRGILTPGRDFVVYRDVESLREAVERMLSSPDERRELAQSGQREVLARHLYRHRAAWIKSHLEC
ncbi:MAG: glycosyltransferase [bacterium]